ncbi:putative odorant receptor 19b [Manduca sexta]|nr:putative odorant receptor 19b [Manduca sexta]
MHRLSKIMNIFVTIAAVCWLASNVVQRLRDESTAQVQLKMIKHNLKHLFDETSLNKSSGLYDDVTEKKLYKKFVYYVKRYERLVWYITEVNGVFNPSMTFQFLTSSITMCIVIYEMSETSVLSMEFIFLMVLIVILLIQVFLYCYYGNLVRHESESMNTCLYESEWTSSSPRFRRAMLIAMARWSKSMTTRVARIIPLALDTFISIIKFSYTLYTVMSSNKDK